MSDIAQFISYSAGRIKRRLIACRKRLISYIITLRAYRYAKKYYPLSLQIFTHLTVDEKYKLYVLARDVSKMQNAIFLEIGSYLGASAVVIASALSNNSILYCVDTWQNETMDEGLRDTFAEFTENTKTLASRIIPLRGRSEIVASSFDFPLNFIFFDGDHSYEGIKTDVDNWLPKLVNGGIVVFHDSGWAEGVQQVIKDDIMPRCAEYGTLPNMFWAKLL